MLTGAGYGHGKYGMSFKTIRLENEAGVALITLDRPEKLNSFTAEMHRELGSALEQVAGDAEARVLVLTGSGRAFCAGQDLSEDSVAPGGDFGRILEERYNPMIRAIRGLKKPVIAAVNGVAAGAGANLALAADITLAARSANFIQAFSKVGLIPDSGGTYFLPRQIGRARAMGLALLGEPVSGEQAEAWGLIWKCVDDDRLMDEVMSLARRLAEGPTKAFALIKQAINSAEAHSLDQQLDLERDLQRVAGASDDYREGMRAFLEKRAPHFTGR